MSLFTIAQSWVRKSCFFCIFGNEVLVGEEVLDFFYQDCRCQMQESEFLCTHEDVQRQTIANGWIGNYKPSGQSRQKKLKDVVFFATDSIFNRY